MLGYCLTSLESVMITKCDIKTWANDFVEKNKTVDKEKKMVHLIILIIHLMAEVSSWAVWKFDLESLTFEVWLWKFESR